MKKKRPTIGYLMFDLDGGYQHAIWQGVDDTIKEHDVNLICFVGGHLDAPESAQRNIVYDLVNPAQLDGLIVMSSTLGSRVSQERLQEFFSRYESIPLVSIGLGLQGMHNVLVDNQAGLRHAVTHLIEDHGKRRIAFIRGPEGYDEAEQRYQVYVDVLAEHDIVLDPNLVLPGAFQPEDGITAVELLLDKRQVEFDAIMGANDFMVIGALQELQRRGVKIPEEVALVGFDDIVDARSVIPPLTTIRQPLYKQGRQAVEIILSLLEGKSVAQNLLLPTEMVTRQSCGCFSEMTMRATVAFASPQELHLTDKAEIETAVSAQRDPIITALQASHAFNLVNEANWAEQLYNSFLADLAHDAATRSEKGAFLSALERILNESSIMDDSIIEWQDVISDFRQQLIPYVNQNSRLVRAENIWNQSRVLIGEIAERVQYSLRHEAGTQARRVNDIGSKLITTFDLNDLTAILANELPNLNIHSCFLALYEDPANPTQFSRLIMGYDENGRIQLDPDEAVFPTTKLILDGVLPTARTYSMMVQPLYFQKEQLGYVIFEITNRDGLVYETLKGQISSSLKGALLVKQEERRARQLQTVTEVSKITSTILDPTELLQRMSDLVTDRFNLYHAQVYLLNEQGNMLNLVAAAGEVGAQMIQEGWQIPMRRGQSIITRAVKTRDVILVDNVQEFENWLANEKLPDTKAEMAIPIMLQQEIVGVLDIQSDQIAGLDENDANLLRSLASQVAVNLNNARLFAETLKAKEDAEKAQKTAESLRAEAERAKAAAEEAQEKMAVQVWQTTGQTKLNQRMSGEQDMTSLANNVIRQLCLYLNAQIGALYMVHDTKIHLLGSYAFSSKRQGNTFNMGEGLIGQAALDKQAVIIKNVADDYITVSSGLGEMVPRHIMVVPFVYEDEVLGVIELGTIAEFSQQQFDFLETAVASISIAFNTARARTQIDDLLVQTQKQAEELQAQGEELRVANEELEAQTESLRISEAKLKEKQIELETTNTQLEEKAAALEESSSALREKQAALDIQNKELKEAQNELERKAAQLALASKYKSEFLANMSHELRTPLNSLLILARMLLDDQEGNLTSEQVESLQIIYGGGNDLLDLINDILDLSKVESGKMAFNIEPMPLTDILSSVESQFSHVAAEKGLEFNLSLDDELPATIATDQQRVLQILKNLLSNAFKFTAKGSVSLSLYKPDAATALARAGLEPANTVAMSVADTGIGMTPEQKKLIFEAFQQADGSTSRQYGGTGLGLSISRELAHALGGEIEATSEEGMGSTFTLYLPLAAGIVAEETEGEVVTAVSAPPPTKPTPPKQQKTTDDPTHTMPAPPRTPAVADDRNELQTGDKTLLLIEDDSKFAKIVYDFAHKNGFKCLMAANGRTGISLVENYKPNAIILDLNLPDMSGWEILEKLKKNPETRHIPVHIASVDAEAIDAYRKGAMGYLTKPVSKEDLEDSFGAIEEFISKKIKSLLLVEDDENSRYGIQKLLGGHDVQITEAAHGQKALDLLKEQRYDCIILDLTLPDMTGFELLNKMNGVASKCPIIVYTGRNLAPEENDELLRYADSVIVKGVKSPERLIDETALFLHRVVADMPKEKQQTIKQLHNTDAALKDKRILVVDDDMRNSFALAKLLSEKGITVKIAPNGQKALDLLAVEPIDLVLMDIMMPVMDGYEATRRIRQNPEFSSLPVLALTAKAMKGDREKCIAAGANDYLPKPVDVDRLFSMLRVWLYQ